MFDLGIRHSLGLYYAYILINFSVLFWGLETGPDVELHERLAWDAVLTVNKCLIDLGFRYRLGLYYAYMYLEILLLFVSFGTIWKRGFRIPGPSDWARR